MTQLSQEVRAIAALLRSTGLPHRITSTYRAGGSSRHGQIGTGGVGLAVDVAGRIPFSVDRRAAEADMLAMAQALVPYSGQMYELIYAGLPFAIVRGRRVPIAQVSPSLVAAHRDHIHIAVRKGVFLAPIPHPEQEIIEVPDDPNLPNITPPLSFHVVQDSDGVVTGYYVFSSSTGELHGHGPGAPYFGRSEVVS